MTRTFAPQCRVVAFDDGAARLSALLAEIGAAPDVSESRADLDTSAQTCAKTAHVESAPLCEAGGSIYLRHELGIAGRCDRCGWNYPALTLNGRRG